jgi:hypothetical protein
MAEWRITDEQPIRELEDLDHERCVALHNYIVELGWTQRGLGLDTLDKRTWWACYGGDAALENVCDRLDASVISFLKAAWHGFAMETAVEPHIFHRFVGRLCSPDELWANAIYADDEDDSNKVRYLTLYMANSNLGASHPEGLILDQYACTAIQLMSMDSTFFIMNGRQIWLPLEIILDGLLDMIDQGKVFAVSETYNSEQERIGPWIMPSYTQQDLEDTLQAFQHLVNAIYAKMPSQPQSTEKSLLDLVTNDSPQSLPSNSFAYQFLAQSFKPSFTNIAPGLQISQQQPFAPVPVQVEPDKLYPLLLFSSTDPAHQDTTHAPWGEVPISSFSGELYPIATHSAGLYLTETEPYRNVPFEDACKLVLPFLLGTNACARTSDDALIGENKGSKGDAAVDLEPRSTQLYQLGFNHFIMAHDVQLKYVLWNWVGMVEDGKWDVDADGVVGGIEKWKEADTEEHWSDYQLPMRW